MTEQIMERQKAILVTGASTGFGRRITEHLSSQGHFVYAGARKDADIASLNEMDNVCALQLDVTKQADVDRAVIEIERAGRGLYGLVNNAGVSTIGPYIELRDEDYAFTMDVNVAGPIRMIRACGELLIESRGRITTIGSIGGTIVAPMIGVYQLSKRAVEAMTDTLALELAPFGIDVSIIEAGTYATDIGGTTLANLEKNGDAIKTSRYSDGYEAIRKFASEVIPSGGDPLEIAHTVELALFEEKPSRRYMTVPSEDEANATLLKAIEMVAQLNERQKYRLDEDALVSMLRDALKS